MHPSGVAWIAALDEFANRTLLLADTLADDRGGPRRARSFDELLLALAEYYTVLARDRQQQIVEKQFVDFVAAVTELVRRVGKQRPAASIKVPPSEKALRERLRRLTLRFMTDNCT